MSDRHYNDGLTGPQLTPGEADRLLEDALYGVYLRVAEIWGLRTFLAHGSPTTVVIFRNQRNAEGLVPPGLRGIP